MIVLTSRENDKRLAIDPATILAVFERADRTMIHCRISSFVTSDAGLVFYSVNETFDEVMAALAEDTAPIIINNTYASTGH